MTYLETGIYRLSTLSPVHIRAGNLGYGEGTIRVNNTVYVVDTPKLQSEIFRYGGMDAVNTYTRVFSNPNANTNIAQVLNQIGYDYRSEIRKISKGIVSIPGGSSFMKSALGKYFVPGSSIKGAIKTAVLYHTIAQRIASGDIDLDNFVQTQIREYQGIWDRRDQRKFRESFAADLLKDAFQSQHPQEKTWINPPINLSEFGEIITTPGAKGTTVKTLDGTQIHLPLDNISTNLKRKDLIKIDAFGKNKGGKVVAAYTIIDKLPTFSITQNNARKQEPKGPFTDIFKAIKVKDAMIEDASEVQTEEILFTSLNRNNQITRKRMGGNRHYECFHGKTDIEISIDHNILESFKRAGATPPFSDLTSLMNICRNFAGAQWGAEQRFLAAYAGGSSLNLHAIGRFYTDPTNMNRATLRVGWGTGMLGTTLSLLLDQSTRVELRNTVISDGNHVRPYPAPKSRRFVLDHQQPIYPLGWIEIA